MQALIFTPDTFSTKPHISPIAGIGETGVFEKNGFTIQFRDIEELKSRYTHWVEVTLTPEEEKKIFQMDLATLGTYIQSLIAQSSKKVEHIISPAEVEFA